MIISYEFAECWLTKKDVLKHINFLSLFFGGIQIKTFRDVCFFTQKMWQRSWVMFLFVFYFIIIIIIFTFEWFLSSYTEYAIFGSNPQTSNVRTYARKNSLLVFFPSAI